MGPLAVASLAPATLNAVSALRPVQNVGQNGGTTRSTTVTGQDLAQDIFQRTFQAAATFAVAEPATGSVGLLQDAAASLLAALNAPQPAAGTTTPTEAPTPAATNPIATDTAATTAPSPTPPALTVTDLPAAQDTFGTSLSSDFALQTALRFGANVLGGASPAQATSEGTGLVRDATSVLRTGNVQPHAGGPGPEAYQLRNQAGIQQAIRTYQAPPALEQPAGLDLLV